MIRGFVNARREAVLALRIRDSQGAEIEAEAIIDTGFSASLTMPPSVIASLGLRQQSAGRATLADGTVRQFDVFPAEVLWDGVWRPVLVSAAGNEILIGMQLLERFELRIEVTSEGAVELTRLI